MVLIKVRSVLFINKFWNVRFNVSGVSIRAKRTYLIVWGRSVRFLYSVDFWFPGLTQILTKGNTRPAAYLWIKHCVRFRNVSRDVSWGIGICQNILDTPGLRVCSCSCAYVFKGCILLYTWHFIIWIPARICSLPWHMSNLLFYYFLLQLWSSNTVHQCAPASVICFQFECFPAHVYCVHDNYQVRITQRHLCYSVFLWLRTCVDCILHDLFESGLFLVIFIWMWYWFCAQNICQQTWVAHMNTHMSLLCALCSSSQGSRELVHDSFSFFQGVGLRQEKHRPVGGWAGEHPTCPSQWGQAHFPPAFCETHVENIYVSNNMYFHVFDCQVMEVIFVMVQFIFGTTNANQKRFLEKT